MANHGAVGRRDPIELSVEAVRIHGVGQLLGAHEVAEIHEGVIEQGVGDPALLRLACQFGVPVAGELEPERGPGGHPQVAEAQGGIDEVEVVMQALGLGGLEESLPAPLIVPRLEGRARFHRREDMDQPGVVAPLGEELLDSILLPEVLPADELDLQPLLTGQALGVAAELVPERPGPGTSP